jgi:transposase-like protein
MTDLRYCPGCLKKQQRINELTEEVERLRAKVRAQERSVREGVFGSSTPSSKIPVKAGSPAESQARRGGAKPGHKGHGRETVSEPQAEWIERVALPEHCPECGGDLVARGLKRRAVIEAQPLKVERIVFQLEQKRCARCGKAYQAKPPGVLPKALYGNQLLTHVAVQHYLYGTPLGQLERQTGVGYGSLLKAMSRLARSLESVPERLIAEYRRADVRHADETAWRTDGQNGYAWLFCTADLSLFRFRATRAASVPAEVLGPKPLGGVLVVDRYNGYNRAPCALQYCYAHLLRDVQDLEKNFPENGEVRAFVLALAPLLAQAIQLRGLSLTKAQFLRQATALKRRIQRLVRHEAKHPAIWTIQNLFRDKAYRLYHWTRDRNIPADNNLAERDLRRLVIARKVSFGSQSPAGAKTRETLMTVLHTLRKRTADVSAAFKNTLDHVALDPSAAPYPLLFPPDCRKSPRR